MDSLRKENAELYGKNKELREALENVKKNDKTRPYEYSGKDSKNKNGEAPEAGKRWATPYEIADKALSQGREGDK
jgi:hypothetical protein